MILKFKTSQTQTCDEFWDETLDEILMLDGNLSPDQVTKEDNRSNKQYLYKPKDFYTSVRDEIYMHIVEPLEQTKILWLRV